VQWNESLVDKMKAGDQDALEQCYRQLSPLIYKAIFNKAKRRDTGGTYWRQDNGEYRPLPPTPKN
jgi:hypothetical protein